MRLYLKIISHIQNILLALSIVILAVLPNILVFYPDDIEMFMPTLYVLVHVSLFFVMSIRPLADLLPSFRQVRPLVILRKGAGVFSAAIATSFVIASIIQGPSAYWDLLTQSTYWSFSDYALFAHLADGAGIILLLTSNSFSKRILGRWWKRIQRLSYVYFYASGIFVVGNYADTTVLIFMILVTVLTFLAFLRNAQKRRLSLTTEHNESVTTPTYVTQ